MYKVLCDNVLMYDPRYKELALINPVVKLEENKAGSFSFKIIPSHPLYDAIKRRKSVIEVYQDEELIFCGVCIEEKADFYKQKQVTCEGELAYLNDSIQRPEKYQDVTVRGLLEAFIDNHNAQVEESKQFKVGMVTVTDNNDSLYCYTNMNSTMKEIKEDLVDDLGGFLRVRHADGIRYIDYLADAMNTNAQEIRIGENLMDFTNNIDSTEIATAIIPLGATLAESKVEGLETKLTIEDVNDGLDYVYSAEAVEAYGWIFKTVEWNEVTTPEALKRKGEQYLAEIQFENMVINAKAIDLHLTDKDIETFKLSDQIRVVSPPHGLNKLFRLTKLTLNLLNPEKNTITLGKEEYVSLSAKSNQANEEIKKVIESIVPPNKIISQAVENATALITSAMGGYVVKTKNELLIMDTDNIETAQKVWRWNINGLGYSSTGYKGEYALAMTMDGQIVADFIKAGTMYADRIKGGTLTVGGSNNDNGVINVRDEKGNIIGCWDKDGINISTGTIIANAIKGGILSLGGLDNANGVLSVKDAEGNEVGRWDKDGIILPDNATIAWENVTGTEEVANTDDIPTDSDITKISEKVVSTATLKASQIKGGTLEMGGEDNVSGVIAVFDEKGNQIGTWNKEGLVLKKGVLEGVTIQGSDLISEAADGSYMRIANGRIINGNSDGELGSINMWKNESNGRTGIGIGANYIVLDALHAYYGFYEIATLQDIANLSNSLYSYATKTELANYVAQTELSNYATKTELNNYVTATNLSSTLNSYVTSSALSSTLTNYLPKGNCTGTITFVKSVQMIGSQIYATGGSITVQNGLITNVY